MAFALAACGDATGGWQGPAARGVDGRAPLVAVAELNTHGGQVESESFWLDVGGEVVPDGQTPAVSLRRGPKLDEQLERFHDHHRYRAFGPSMEVEVPFDSDRPAELTVSFDPAELPVGFQPRDLTVFAYSPTTFDPVPKSPPSQEVFPDRDLAPLRTRVDVEAGLATVQVHRSGVFQLVALREPITWRPPDGAAAEARAQELQARAGLVVGVEPVVRATHTEERSRQIRQTLRTATRESLRRYARLGFATPPLDRITVIASASTPTFTGNVGTSNVIRINPSALSDRQIAKMIAHQVFHLVQYRNTNLASIAEFFGDRDDWMVEGAANWAADVVYDSIPALYHAPKISRFRTPLTKPGGPSFAPHVYQTVAFWKWLEAKHPGTLARTFARLRRRTRTIVTPEYRLPSQTPVSMDGLFRDSPATLDMLSFFEDVLYYKDFERDETDRDELWGNLGARWNVGISVRLGATVLPERAMADGGSVEPITEIAVLPPTLTADTKLIKNRQSPEALEGRIHVEFQPTSNDSLAATVICRDSHRKKQVVGLDTVRQVTFPFRAGTEILIIAADTEWESSSDRTTRLDYRIWVEPAD